MRRGGGAKKTGQTSNTNEIAAEFEVGGIGVNWVSIICNCGVTDPTISGNQCILVDASTSKRYEFKHREKYLSFTMRTGG